MYACVCMCVIKRAAIWPPTSNLFLHALSPLFLYIFLSFCVFFVSILSFQNILIQNIFLPCLLFGIHYVVVANKNIEPRMKTPYIKSWFYIKLSLCSVLFGLKSSLHLSSDTVFAVLHTLLRLYCVHILSVSHPPSAAAVSFLLFFFNFSSTTFIFGSDLLKYLLLRHNVFIIPWASGSCFQGCSKKLPPHKSLHMCLCCTLLPVCYHITPNSFQICQL